MELTGSEKQVAWATRIRKELLARAESACDDYRRIVGNAVRDGKCSPEQAETNMGKMVAALTTLSLQESAAWWIEHRDETSRKLLALFLPGPQGE